MQAARRLGLPVTSKFTGGSLAEALSSLLAKGLVKEVRAKQGEPHWRLDDERFLTLMATPPAFEALGIGPGKRTTPTKPRSGTASRSKQNGAPTALAKLEHAHVAHMAIYHRIKHGYQQVIRIEKMELQAGSQAVVGQIGT